MVRKSLFLSLLPFLGTVTFCSEMKIPSGVGSYDTLVHLAAVGSRVQDDHNYTTQSKDYYDSVVDEAAERRWAFPFAFNYTLESRRFGCDGCKQSIGESIFGTETAIRDVFLLARVSEQDKLYRQNREDSPFDVIGRGPTRPFNVGFGGNNPPFGQYTDEQYLSLIAPAKIGASASRHALDFNFSGMYRFKPFSGRKFYTIIGFNLPVRLEIRSMDLQAYDGSLFTTGFSQNQTIRETTLSQFFKDFTSIEDFFIRAVLGSKGLEFQANQERIGIGDISLFAIAECGPYFREFCNGFCVSLDTAQLGINVSVPSASKCCGNKVWEIDFGNGGGYQITLFNTYHFRTELNALNPFFHFGIEFYPKYCASCDKGTALRAPKLVTHTDTTLRLNADPGVPLPSINEVRLFGEYFSDEFAELDSTVPLFGTLVPRATVKLGRRFFFGIGNYFYDIFKTRFRLGVFYTYSTKKADCFYVADSSFDTSCLSYKSKSHRVGWNLTYQTEHAVEVGFGSQHIFSGCNVPEQHEVFASLAVSF